MFGNASDTTSDPAKFAEWEQKIQDYRDQLQAGILDDFKAPDHLIPLQEELDRGIDVTEFATKVLSPKEIAITESLGTELAATLARGELTAVEVFTAFAKRATIAHQLTNCAMQLFVEEGLERAKELDAYYAQHKKTVGPLHGLPISLKEHYSYKGKVTHLSYVGWLDNVSPEYAKTLKDMLAQGAIFYVRTTEPQMLMHLCSNNNITGKCRNPANTSLTPGGSSSGEGAITAMKGSVFGMGSDIGGSIRVPAAFCGVWGLRPSQKRISLLDSLSCYVDQGQEVVYPVLGPLARCADDIDLFMKSLLDMEPWTEDPLVLPIPWRSVPEPEAKSLKIAICFDDGIVKPTPPVVRALKHAEKKLKEAGVEVVEWENIDVESLVRACNAGYNFDGNMAQKKILALSGEPLVPLSESYIKFGCGDDGLSGQKVQELCFTRDLNRIKYLQAMNEQGIDFILSPTYVSVASKPEVIKYWGYSNLWNILDFPNVIFPSGMKVEVSKDAVDPSFVARNDIEEYEYSLYTGPEEFVGAPISLQLTGRRYNDESVVKAAKVVESIISAPSNVKITSATQVEAITSLNSKILVPQET